MKDKKTVWKHNSYIGYAVLARRNALEIQNSPTVSPIGKALADQIEELALKLEKNLRAERIDN